LSFYRWQGENLLLSCHLQPRASKDEFCGLHGDSLKIRITAPPVDGRANAHLMKFLAKQFSVARGAITIVSGELGRQKRISIAAPSRLPEALEIERD